MKVAIRMHATVVVCVLTALAATIGRGALAGPGVGEDIANEARAQIVELRNAYVIRAAQQAKSGALSLIEEYSGPPTATGRIKRMASVFSTIEKEHDAVGRKLDKLRDKANDRLARLNADPSLLNDVTLTHSTARGVSYSARSDALSDVYEAVGFNQGLILE